MRLKRLFGMPFVTLTLAGSILLAAGRVEVSGDFATDRDPDADAWAEQSLAQMSLRQRVAQLVVPWIRGGDIPRSSAEFRRIRRWIEDDQVGGLIVSRGPLDEFAPMLNALQSLAPVPLLIVSDLETGPGMRLTGGTNLPPAMAFGAAGDERLAYEAGRLTAAEARAAGIHITLGPVLDLNSNPRNPIINTRSFGADPRRVARMATAWIAGARDGGLLTTGKHFPGHGGTDIDSHVGLPTLTAGDDRLASFDLVPFRDAIDAGLDAVLVGHIAVPAIDGPGAPPASISSGIIRDLLREQLGFDGLVFTDALNMGAITRNYSVAEASIRALLAGADVLLQPPGERQVIDAIVAAVEDGRLPRSRIDDAARRVLLAKAAAGLHVEPVVHAPGGRPPTSHASTAAALTASSLTLVRDRDDLVPLHEGVRDILHIVYDSRRARLSGTTLTAELRASGRPVSAVTVDDGTTSSEYRSLADRARRADLVIVSSSLVPRQYRGPLVLEQEFASFVDALTSSGARVVVVSFGSPYLLDFFPGVSSYLLSWSATAESQRAAARALLGREPVTGRLPVPLPPYHAVGEGISRGVGSER